MIAILRPLLALLICLSLSACASTTALESQTKARDAKLARVYFVRAKTMVGVALSPDIKVDGKGVGNLAAGSAFFIDRPAGHYKLTLDHEFEPGVYNRDITLVAGQTQYFQVVQEGRLPLYVAIGPSMVPINGGGNGIEGPFQLRAIGQKEGEALIASVQN
ncbi:MULTISPECIES: DUF2846 domain-containing protein [Rhodomicrobium]|uniref:DUF2846 domain-containing protein n=1 Tax=Rhodomicrobium TaxID=1068 RepID=UPI0014830ED9|nr:MULTISPECIES: DUF2846 domain-containing protein [Rhodomicrobium]